MKHFWNFIKLNKKQLLIVIGSFLISCIITLTLIYLIGIFL